MSENTFTLEQFREWGRQGGLARSKRKAESSARNVAVARVAQARKILAEVEAKPAPEPSLAVPALTFDELDTP